MGAPSGPPAPIGPLAGVTRPLLAFALDGHPAPEFELPAPRRRHSRRPATFASAAFFVIAWLREPPGVLSAGRSQRTSRWASRAFIAAARAHPHHRAVALVWNIGVTDLITAVSLGVAHSSSTLGVLATAVKTDALARYPFSLIPTFFVPIALILHLLSLRGLRRGAAPAA
jgi:hypothetical protein